MKLQILIPRYNEPYEIVRRLLVSIAQQQNIDFNDVEVIICDDGSDIAFPEEKLHQYPFNIKYFIIEHGGPAVARQALMDISTADYIMFCDADDMFIDMLGLWYVWGDFISYNYDLIASTFIEEFIADSGEHCYTKIERDSTFVHGKFFRRQYLLDNDIKFNTNLTVHEDEYFISLVIGCIESFGTMDYFDNPFYLWRWNDESVCRKNKDVFILYTYNQLIDSFDYLIFEFLQRKNMSAAQYYCVNFFYDVFYTLNKPQWMDELNREYRDDVENRFVGFYKKYFNLFNSCNNDLLLSNADRMRNIARADGLEIEHIAFPTWLNHIKELSEQLPE